jgi:hypothetical protein
MRARRRFQPMLDSMPIRIAPSAMSVPVLALVQTAPISLPTPQHVVSQDTLMPETGHSSPIILEPITSPPPSLPC